MEALDPDALRRQLLATLTKSKVDKLKHVLSEFAFDLRNLVDLTFDTDATLAFRAAWLLENVILHDPARHRAAVDYLLSRVPEVTNGSCKRHYARIMAYVTSLKAGPVMWAHMAGADTKLLVEQCFNWIIDPKVLVAVKVKACEALCNLRHQHPWIADELTEQLQHLMRNGSAAMQQRGKKLLEVLEKSKLKSQNSKRAGN